MSTIQRPPLCWLHSWQKSLLLGTDVSNTKVRLVSQVLTRSDVPVRLSSNSEILRSFSSICLRLYASSLCRRSQGTLITECKTLVQHSFDSCQQCKLQAEGRKALVQPPFEDGGRFAQLNLKLDIGGGELAYHNTPFPTLILLILNVRHPEIEGFTW